MKKLFSLVLTLTLFSAVSCGDSESSKGIGEECKKASDCKKGLKCIDFVCVDSENTTDDIVAKDDADEAEERDDTENIGNTGNTGDDSNTGNSGDTGNTGNTGNTGDTGNTGNSGNSGDTAETDSICGNNLVEGDEVCDGNRTTCKELGLGDSNTMVKCSENCDSWITAGFCKRKFACSPKPEIGTVWNSVGEYEQIWDGEKWEPADSETEHNTERSSKLCRYKCDEEHHYAEGECVYNYKATSCVGLPENGEWNDVSEIITDSWDGSKWIVEATPGIGDLTGVYREIKSDIPCSFKCSKGYGWDTSAKKCEESIYPDFPHKHAGLYWSNATGMKFNEVKTHCDNFGGRPATISELRTLIKNCSATEAGGTCGVISDCYWTACRDNSCDGCVTDDTGKYSVFGDNSRSWSSRSHGTYSNQAWYIGFDKGIVDALPMYYGLLVRCVKK
ncbi:MAG: hypothetical protein ACOX2F_10775 [bacterium]